MKLCMAKIVGCGFFFNRWQVAMERKKLLFSAMFAIPVVCRCLLIPEEITDRKQCLGFRRKRRNRNWFYKR